MTKSLLSRLSRNLPAVAALVVVPFAIVIAHGAASSAEPAVTIPPPAVDVPAGPTTETAIFAGGCFWGVQGVFQHVKGVTNAVSGYAGGAKGTAEYETVSTGTTGHAESVKVTFDPRQVTYGQLLQVYFSVAHNPTELNFQGPDSGTQYRSAIFPANDDQARVAASYISQLGQAHAYSRPVVTKIEPGKAFYPAEGYHQDFLAKNPTYPYIAENDMPKVADLQRLFPQLYRDAPVLTSAGGGA